MICTQKKKTTKKRGNKKNHLALTATILFSVYPLTPSQIHLQPPTLTLDSLSFVGGHGDDWSHDLQAVEDCPYVDVIRTYVQDVHHVRDGSGLQPEVLFAHRVGPVYGDDKVKGISASYRSKSSNVGYLSKNETNKNKQ